jgi:UDP-N-acetylglucosamine:LPS N-acetylglucosamine transferase
LERLVPLAKKRVLILSSDYGFGHLSAAKAVSAALEAQDSSVEVRIANPMKHEMTPDILRDIQDLYDESSKQQGLYELLYKISDTSLYAAATNTAVGAMLRDSVYSEIKEMQPHVIVSVHQDYLAALKSLYEAAGFKIPIVTVITDLTTIHRRWYSRISSMTVVPTDAGYNLAVEHGLREDRIKQIGIPVHPRFVNESRSQAELIKELGWYPDKRVILVVGSKRVSNLTENLRGINHANLDIQLVLVAGGDDKLHREFMNTAWHLPTHIYNYVSDLPAFMHASDIVISKAGGLIVAETLACKKPILITDVIEGQETGNSLYVLEHGAGERAFNPLDVLETVYHWLMNDAEILKIRSQKAAALGRPQAAFEIADLVLSLVEKQKK